MQGSPSLTWTGEPGYTSGGVSPAVGVSSAPYAFRVNYKDFGLEAPGAGYPRVVIRKGAAVVATLPMNYVSGGYPTGAVYSASTLLVPCSYYTYTYEAQNDISYAATPLSGGGPDVRVSISGAVRDPSGAPMSDVTVTLSGGASGTFLTGADGAYSFPALPAGGTYTITPSSAAYLSFTPASFSTAAVSSDIAGWNFARANSGAALSWAGGPGYTSDGVDPDSGPSQNPFTFRVRYADPDGDPPAAGYPLLHVLKTGAEISGSPFQMATIDSGGFTTGRIYSASETLTAMGGDYSYYMEARDSQGGPLAATAGSAGPLVGTQPVLSWTGEPDYSGSGVSPSTGAAGDVYAFRVKYTDFSGVEPDAGYPRVRIYNGGVEMPGSPFTMSYVSGAAASGEIYTWQTALSTGMAYSYIFEARNLNMFDAAPAGGYGPQARTRISGHVTDAVANPLSSVTMTLSGADSAVYITGSNGYYEFLITTQAYTVTPSSFTYYQFSPANRSYTNTQSALPGEDYTRLASGPGLSWTGEPGYTAGGVSPGVGQSSVTYTFRVRYADENHDAPGPGYPRVVITKGAAAVATLPMNYVSGDYLSGAVYSTSTLLAPCSFYSYAFEAEDVFGTPAAGLNGSGPDVRALLSGTVRNADGSPMAAVTLTLSGGGSGTFLTGTDGTYSFQGLSAGGSYVVTPSSGTWYLFTPSSAAVALVSDMAGVDFQRSNSAPALSWTGETNYSDTIVYPSTAPTGTGLFTFRVAYRDADGEDFRNLKLFIKKAGVVVDTIAVTGCAGAAATGMTCGYSTTIGAGGFYNCKFTVTGAWGEVVSTTESAFLADLPPSAPAADSSVIADGQTVLSSEVPLRWSAANPGGGPLTYDLYVSHSESDIMAARGLAGVRPAASGAAPVYSGPGTSYVLRNLDPGRTYYWKINATDQYGVTTEGSPMTFTTLGLPLNSMFNYPNPFNPAREQTRIVFSVSGPQTVKVRIYSEYGDLLRTLTAGAAAGTNEVKFDGRDGSGRPLYNGSYIAVISKSEGTARCYILIVR